MAAATQDPTKIQNGSPADDASNGEAAGLPSSIIVEEYVTVRALAERMDRSPIDLIKVLMQFGIMAPIDQTLDHDTAAIVGEELGIEVLWPVVEDEEPEQAPDEDRRPKERVMIQAIVAEEAEQSLVPRPPVVAVLGHVDHGKTTLLDRIRRTNVVDSEAGGITQHTGAYQVEVDGKKITFLDTPGHEAFTAMRARGAQVTDIVILVVAADDGIMPQTREAISHARAAGVTIIVAINKIDSPTANVNRVMEELSTEDLAPEEWGGETITVPISALNGEGVDDLLDNILVVAELDQHSANPKGQCVGTVIEAQLDKQRGITSTLLVQNGTLKRGDSLVVGENWGRVKAMSDYEGNQLKMAGPSTPTIILGLNGVPAAGEVFTVTKNDRAARTLAAERQNQASRDIRAASPLPMTLEDMFARVEGGEAETLNIIVRADAQGSLAPIIHSLEQLENDEVKVKILQSAVGDITESDVMLAETSQAVVIGFGVNIDKAALVRAEQSGVEIRHYQIIYNLIEDVEQALSGMLDPIFEEVVTGHAEVRQMFRVRRGGLIAGCMVLDGVVKRNSQARLLRNDTTVITTSVENLKRFTEDVTEVRAGYECGINLAGVNSDLQEGDIIEVFERQQVR
ncbi:MAG: translation initiation factor IF-2 [Caldilineaceae bacterium SB0661_bin_32]|uniref:Translation initiation factor IF-2 n=1 Tax=Caldilineaceae bacterium SB0661_bin_32 TaxID=2605255 RepID=A0A6B1DB01_9CHLR|nr:translation initiation factor IF-2 [Caldilineaceae bacterium SB0661_bin_32]